MAGKGDGRQQQGILNEDDGMGDVDPFRLLASKPSSAQLRTKEPLRTSPLIIVRVMSPVEITVCSSLGLTIRMTLNEAVTSVLCLINWTYYL